MQKEFSLHFEWQDVKEDGIKGKELAATWASLSIVVKHAVITQFNRTSTSNVRKQLNIPLYPLAEWVVQNWWCLLWEPQRSFNGNSKEYANRHNIIHAREGYALPNLTFTPNSDKITLSWKRDALQYSGIEFLTSGQTELSRLQIETELTNFIEAVIERLERFEIHDTVLQEEWYSIREMDEEEREFCELAGKTGLNPFEISKIESDNLIAAYEGLQNEIRDDFFSACSPTTMLDDVIKISEIIDRKKCEYSDQTSLKLLRDRIRPKRQIEKLPWSVGYYAARELRNELGLNGHIFGSLSDIGDVLNIKMSSMVQFEPLPHFVTAIGGTNMGGTLYSVVGSNLYSRNEKEKFAFCRSLYGYLFNEDVQTTLVTSSLIESQKTNRAFAAEFLAPASLIERKILDTTITEEEIADIADHFSVDEYVIKHQIRNHKIAEIVQSD